jgi:hypothetical protein
MAQPAVGLVTRIVIVADVVWDPALAAQTATDQAAAAAVGLARLGRVHAVTLYRGPRALDDLVADRAAGRL